MSHPSTAIKNHILTEAAVWASFAARPILCRRLQHGGVCQGYSLHTHFGKNKTCHGIEQHSPKNMVVIRVNVFFCVLSKFLFQLETKKINNFF